MKTLFRLISLGIPLGVSVLIGPRLISEIFTKSMLFSTSTVPPARAAVVFGAGLQRDGSPTTVLRDRVATAAELYFSGKVEILLMSGDNSYAYYNEPAAMRAYALQLGVPDALIVLDYAGRRTYDTCYRAKAIFGLSKAILVTQQFHLPRALFTCRALGLEAVGVPADRREYRPHSLFYWNLRELPATLNAFIEVLVTHPVPVLGEPEPIIPERSQ